MTDADPAAASVQGGQMDAILPAQEKNATNDSTTTSTIHEPEIHYPSGIILVLIVSGLLLSMFLVALDMSIIATAIPRITSEFNSMEDIGWYGSAFFLTLASFQSMWGKAYKYYSLRLVFIASIALFEVGSLVCALAPNSLALVIGRAIQGAGGAGLTGGCYTIAAFVVRPAKVPIIIGLLGSTFSLASVVGPLLGGVFSESVSWRWCFYINLPIGGVAVLTMLLFRTPKHAKNHSKMGFTETIINFDIAGLVLLLCSLICFFLALQWGGVSRQWSSGTIIALGLIYTFGFDTALGPVIGYQILYGVGTGLSVQIPVIVAGATSTASDSAVTLSTVLFFQFVSAAYGVGATDAILNNVILNTASGHMGGVDGHDVLSAGAGGLGGAFQGDLLRGARSAYLDGLHASWALAIALFGVTFLCAVAPTGVGRLSPKEGPN
ncbi:hypothetical protein SLS64_013775 [Diaporthe eres]